ncbi:TIGR04282 family arsenosugar biosynthesis glycosyltransferase [Rhodohalobacter sp.]|uniref:TIGR04282 family arsenosugar biosynthesis glycosyltransferase n=1 Tax=Rhodohalobacter sp. TaxID=1974210 RepID=UPI002ACE80F5|nr:TIGR04282 family arsenosugar biosynthesis glycosyltransferase [Rhodohalobacter sp.]MDZ7758466.1 TIGR04282 family arsenosugar biosynthesis glycosyltransferase [Rhodohalobacter sp.]
MNKNELIIFVKNPVEGEVKTRLASSVGDEKALEVYQQLLKITARETAGVKADKLVSYSKYVEESDDFEEDIFEKSVQIKGNLGEKMKHAFRSGFDQGYHRIVLIGSDCPKISQSLIDEAFEKLSDADSVIGPSDDGGYYLIGLSRFMPEIFDDIEWSTSSVFSSTVKALDDMKATYHVLKKLNDIDTESDLNASDLLI